MAVASFSSLVLVQNSGPIIKPRSKTKMLKLTQFPLKKAPALQVRSSFKDKVFENQSEGIICYRDDSGEIICEGLDEGPRFHQQLPRTAYHSRDTEIINLLQQRLLQVVSGGEFNKVDNGVAAVQEDFKRNGFNKFC
ncbi:hypothetical protein P3X46_001668 [Hevea brasiliensis]|uniref:Uncharacterized protein n=1 Tax=Hevea brasiliensis TaxID=3981 RepID=A0ABQ9NFI1_HEVBR|nr:uncharacterized protein LOC110634653 isoform X2 [Hevea brasiliensis]KAJ9190468.1 hypothetical protein P3X46_001668 [Hevea brasiliensis]